MAKKRSSRATAAARAAQTSISVVLDADALVEVLRAAKAAGVLPSLASTSKQLCRLARSRVPLQLRVHTQQEALLLIGAQAHGGGPFTGCNYLYVAAEDMASCLMTSGIISAAQHWAALEQLHLTLTVSQEQLQLVKSWDACVFSMISCLPALQQLRDLTLQTPAFGVCSARQVAQLVALTRLELSVFMGGAADLTAVSCLTNLVELVLVGPPTPHPAAAAAAAAGAGREGELAGPFCLPSSLMSLALRCEEDALPATIVGWVSHLPGCPQLQQLDLVYGREQHPRVHPSALVPQLVQHTPQLRTLSLAFNTVTAADVDWAVPVEGLAEPAAVVDWEWHPGAALAALKGLECLRAGGQLCIASGADWQGLGQLRALTQLKRAVIGWAPPQQCSTTLALLDLRGWTQCLGGRQLGCLLLACPCLQEARLAVCLYEPEREPPAARRPLPRHPTLQAMVLRECNEWALGAAAEFVQLAPVLAGVQSLALDSWPHDNGTVRAGALPDLSACTALTALVVDSSRVVVQPEDNPPEQEAFLSMAAPLVQLQALSLCKAPRVTARMALPLQHMLPRLQRVVLGRCGRLIPISATVEHLPHEQQQREQKALEAVQQLLRPGLVLDVNGCAD